MPLYLGLIHSLHIILMVFYIRIWNYEKGVPINAFEIHTFPDKGISKLCLLNELSDALLLVASCKAYTFVLGLCCSKKTFIIEYLFCL